MIHVYVSLYITYLKRDMYETGNNLVSEQIQFVVRVTCG
jgi:hypothetical protein